MVRHFVLFREPTLAETSTQEINRKTNVVIHPDFDSSLLDYDYALIQLPKPLDFNGAHKHLGPICLPDATDPFMFENMTCIVSGWGLTGFVGEENSSIIIEA